MRLNWWALTTICFWIIGGFVAIFTKNTNALDGSLAASICLGVLYIIMHSDKIDW